MGNKSSSPDVAKATKRQPLPYEMHISNQAFRNDLVNSRPLKPYDLRPSDSVREWFFKYRIMMGTGVASILSTIATVLPPHSS